MSCRSAPTSSGSPTIALTQQERNAFEEIAAALRERVVGERRRMRRLPDGAEADAAATAFRTRPSDRADAA